jgi:hypothetical protein
MMTIALVFATIFFARSSDASVCAFERIRERRGFRLTSGAIWSTISILIEAPQ